MSSRERGIGHVAALDGVRGLAVLLVVSFHFTVFAHMTADTVGERVYRGLSGAGWIGVDLFFVLSGFLITGILLDTKEGNPRFFRNFYARRTLRIFPLYYVSLVLLLWVLPSAFPRLSPPSAGEAVWFVTYVSNVFVALHGWGDPFVTHFWSLAIEEQFYLAWPMVVFFTKARSLSVVCFALCVFGLLLRASLVLFHHEMAAYTLTPCRADALAAGGLVACLVRSRVSPARIARVSRIMLVGTGGAIAVLFGARHGLHFGDPLVATLGFSLLAGMFAALVAATFVAPDTSPLKRLFCCRPLRFFGKYSYGIYVFHQPVAALMEQLGIAIPTLPRIAGSHLVTQLLVTAVGAAISLILALASWHLLEVHFLRLKAYFDTKASGVTSGSVPIRSTE